jgi:predicted  nucleic acid-binding Zn-ribbon protein
MVVGTSEKGAGRVSNTEILKELMDFGHIHPNQRFAVRDALDRVEKRYEHQEAIINEQNNYIIHLQVQLRQAQEALKAELQIKNQIMAYMETTHDGYDASQVTEAIKQLMSPDQPL